MFKFSFCLILAFVFLVNSAASQTKFRKKGTLEIQLFGGNSEGSSYFHADGSDMSAMPDYNPMENSTDRNYRYRFSTVNFGIGAEYALTDNFALFGSIPLSYTSLTEKGDTNYFYEDYNGDMKLDSTTFIRADLSLFQPDYFALGMKYKLYDKKAYALISTECRFPVGTHDGILNDPDYDILSDGAFQVLFGGAIGVKFKKIFLETAFTYYSRGEDLVDQYLIHSVFGLSTVESTALTAFVDIVQSTEPMNNVVLFDPRNTTLQEEIIGMGIAVNMTIKDKYDIDVGYRLVLSGKNTSKYGGFFVKFGYLIN
ncbi:MAG: hypothetical protein KAH48_04195 [Chlorobi bacterium]|nr:hypothetical protein [Chlorobiota bacterium]